MKDKRFEALLCPSCQKFSGHFESRYPEEDRKAQALYYCVRCAHKFGPREAMTKAQRATLPKITMSRVVRMEREPKKGPAFWDLKSTND